MPVSVFSLAVCNHKMSVSSKARVCRNTSTMSSRMATRPHWAQALQRCAHSMQIPQGGRSVSNCKASHFRFSGICSAPPLPNTRSQLQQYGGLDKAVGPSVDPESAFIGDRASSVAPTSRCLPRHVPGMSTTVPSARVVSRSATSERRPPRRRCRRHGPGTTP